MQHRGEVPAYRSRKNDGTFPQRGKMARCFASAPISDRRAIRFKAEPVDLLRKPRTRQMQSFLQAFSFVFDFLPAMLLQTLQSLALPLPFITKPAKLCMPPTVGVSLVKRKEGRDTQLHLFLSLCFVKICPLIYPATSQTQRIPSSFLFPHFSLGRIDKEGDIPPPYPRFWYLFPWGKRYIPFFCLEASKIPQKGNPSFL